MDDTSEPAIASPIDLERLSELLGNDNEAALFKYLGMFMGIFPGLIAEIKATILERDPRALHHAAHKAKSAAGSAAAPGIVRILRDLEVNAGQETWEDFQAQFSQLESEYARIEKFCDEHGH